MPIYPPPSSGGGGLPVASQAEAEAGTVNNKTMTPLRTADATAHLAARRPAWTFNENIYFTDTTAAATVNIWVSDVATSGGSGWFTNFLQKSGSGPWLLYVNGPNGLSLFHCTRLSDAGDSYTQFDVTFLSGVNETWSGDYSLMLVAMPRDLKFVDLPDGTE
jgi:hypothetical protein